MHYTVQTNKSHSSHPSFTDSPHLCSLFLPLPSILWLGSRFFAPATPQSLLEGLVKPISIRPFAFPAPLSSFLLFLHLYSMSHPPSLPIVIWYPCHPPFFFLSLPVLTSRVICHLYYLINPLIGCPLIEYVCLSYTLTPNRATYTHTHVILLVG